MKRYILVVMMFIIIGIGCGSAEFTRNIQPAGDAEKVFYGDSITWWCSQFTNGINRAFSGDRSTHLYRLIETYYLDEEFDGTYHILIGINDVRGDETDKYLPTMTSIFELLEDENVVVTSMLPTDGIWANNLMVMYLNRKLKYLTEDHDFTFIDVYSEFEDSIGLLNSVYTNDGLHLNDEGCEKLFSRYQ